MPQAIERLLATPRMTPRLPCIRPWIVRHPVFQSIFRGLEVHQPVPARYAQIGPCNGTAARKPFKRRNSHAHSGVMME